MTLINAKATPFNDNDYNCHNNNYRTCLTNCMEFISRHITPLVIDSLGGGHTHKHTHILTIRTGSILKNQACTGRRPARAGFNKDNKCFRIHFHSLITLEPFICFHSSLVSNLFAYFFDFRSLFYFSKFNFF